MVHNMDNSDFKTIIFQDKRTVFSLKEIGLLLGESNADNLKQKVNYYVHNGVLKNPRRGIYAKNDYSKEELACKIFIPSYISLEYVLQKAGVIFQYSEKITQVSYLSRTLQVDGIQLSYKKIQNDLLINTSGIVRESTGINIATPERAFLDLLYRNKNFYFDNLNILNKKLIDDLLTIYDSKQLDLRVRKVFS